MSSLQLNKIACQSLSLTTLLLDHNPLGSPGLSAVFAGIRDNPRCALVKVSLRYCEGGWECAKDIGDCLATNKSIIELDLTGNILTDQSLPYLTPSIATNTTLQTLILASNQIRNLPDPSAQHSAIMQPPPTMPPTSLDTLPLDAPPALPTTSFTAFLTSLTQNTTLKTLDLRSNHVSAPGALALIEVLTRRKAMYTAKRAEGLVVYVTERMGEEPFEKIGELGDAMISSGGKKKGRGKSAKGKK